MGRIRSLFAWTKGCGKMVIIFPQPFFMTYSDGKFPARRPLEVARATKWRGGAVRQEPQMTTPPGGPPFVGQGSLCASSLRAASYTLLPLTRHFPSRGNKELCRCPLRPLEGERATKWRGGAVRQEPQMTTPPRQAAVWRSGQPLRFISTRSLVHPFAANAAFSLKGKQEIMPLNLAPT